MLHISIYKSARTPTVGFVSSKKINLTDQSIALLQISSRDAKLGSFIENTVIDLIVTHVRTSSADIYSDFWYLLEKLNKYLKEIAKNENISGLNIFLGATDGDSLHFSVLWQAFSYLLKRGKIVNISEWMWGNTELPQFWYISSGTVDPGDSISISNVDLLGILAPEDVIEMSRLNHSESQPDTIESLLSREIFEKPAHVVILSNHEAKKPNWSKHSTYGEYESMIRQWWERIETFSQETLKKYLRHPKAQEWLKKANSTIDSKNRTIRAASFGVGVFVCIGLLYLILSSIVLERANTSVPEEYKNKLIEAQLIIEKSNKDLGNRDVFNANIKRAEELIFAVRQKQIFLNDVKKLLADISILKKQMNGIETFVVQDANAEYLFKNKDFGIESIFEIAKKFYFVGKTGIVGPYLKGEEAKTYPYPDGEEAISSDVTAEGYIYVFTKTGRLLRFHKGEFSYVNVEGQKTWEKGREIRVYNSNLYVLSEDGSQIYKHKPWVSGFSIKSEVLKSEDLKGKKILDFGIDGGFYLIKDDLTMDKIFGLPAYTRRSIVLNGLPENYTLEPNSRDPRLFIAPNLNYLYIILNNQVWIFAPDTKNYKDVKSMKYVGQIEFGEEQVRSVLITKDGSITAGTDRWVYTVNFEVSDGKVIIR